MEHVDKRISLDEMRRRLDFFSLTSDPIIQKLFERLKQNQEDSDAYNRLVNILNPKIEQLTDSETPFVIPHEALDGEVNLLQVKGTNKPFGISREMLSKNIFIVGSVGTGKTNLALLLCIAILRMAVGLQIIAFVPKGKSFWPLLNFDNVVCFGHGEFKWDIFETCKDESVDEWLEMIAMLFAHSTELLVHGQELFYDLIMDFVQKKGLSKLHPFSLYRYMDGINCTESRYDSQVFKRILLRFRSMIRKLRKNLSYTKAHSFISLLENKTSIVFPLDGLGPQTANFNFLWCISKVLRYKEITGDKSYVIFLIDDASTTTLVDYRRGNRPEELSPLIERYLLKLREYNVGLITITHSIGETLRMIRENAGLAFITGFSWLSEENDRLINLIRTSKYRDAQGDYIKGRLKTDLSTALCLDGRSAVPFLVTVPEVQFTSDNQELLKINEERIKQLKSIPQNIDILENKLKNTIQGSSLRYMMIVDSNPYLFQNEVDALYSTSYYAQRKVKSELYQRGWIETIGISVSNKGATIKKCYLTKKGKEIYDHSTK